MLDTRLLGGFATAVAFDTGGLKEMSDTTSHS